MSSLTIISHDFNGTSISQVNENVLINDILIPKGYVNATEMTRAAKKDIKDWLKNKNTIALIEGYKAKLKGGESAPLIAVGNEISFEMRGTWVSFALSMNIAQWCSVDFAIWAGETLVNVIKGDYQALTAEAELAQAKLQQLWQEVRTTGKVTRRKLTDAIKDWYERNPNGTSCPPHVMYALTTNKIYQALWSKEAKEIETLLGCDRNKARDYMSADCLLILERAEDRVCEFIDLDNIKPKDAIEPAHIRPSRIELI